MTNTMGTERGPLQPQKPKRLKESKLTRIERQLAVQGELLLHLSKKLFTEEEFYEVMDACKAVNAGVQRGEM